MKTARMEDFLARMRTERERRAEFTARTGGDYARVLGRALMSAFEDADGRYILCQIAELYSFRAGKQKIGSFGRADDEKMAERVKLCCKGGLVDWKTVLPQWYIIKQEETP